jgi:glycosyltransferase involved in cell wall biosynthesis
VFTSKAGINPVSRHPVSALVLTYNEVDQIAGCLASLAWADEIFVVDSFSTDGTLELVRTEFPRVRIEQHEYFGAGAQRNFALDRLTHDWIFVLDADERVTPQAQAEILRILENPKLWAWEIRRRNFLHDREIRYAGLQRDWVTRLFHRGHARYQNRRVHAEVDVDGRIGQLEGTLLHFYVRSLDHMASKMIRYAVWGAANKFREGKRGPFWKILLRPPWRFGRDFVAWRGFLDGVPGLIITGLHAYYTFFKYAKLWEFTMQERYGLPVSLPPFDAEESRWEKPWEVHRRDGR